MNLQTLTNFINDNLPDNNVGFITEKKLRDSVLAVASFVNNTFGVLQGVAEPSTVPDLTKGNQLWIAQEAGTYTDFDDIVVEDSNGINLLSYTPTQGWIKVTIPIAVEAIKGDDGDPGDHPILDVEDNIVRWKLSLGGVETWTNLFPVPSDGDPGDYFVFDVLAGMLRRRLSQNPEDPWINTFDFLEAVENEVEAVTREPDPDQFGEDSLGNIVMKTPFKALTNGVVDFTTKSTQGISDTSEVPIYDGFTFVEESILLKNVMQKCFMFLSVESVPSIISDPPAFLAGNITGTILTGYANKNLLEFEVRIVKEGTAFVPKVFLTITQGENCNNDAEPPVSGDPLLIFDLQMKESSLAGSSPQALVDSGMYEIATEIACAGNWSDVAQVSNGGYAIGFTSSGSARPFIEIPYAELAEQPLGSNWTIHIGVRLVPGGAFAGMTIMSNNNLANGEGFRMYTASASGETAAVWFSLGAVTSYVSADELRSGSSNRIGATWTYITMTYDGTTLRMYYNGVQITSTTDLASRPVTSTEPILINRRQDSAVGHAGNFEIRRPMIIKKTLTAQEVEDLNTETTNMYNP